MKRKFIKVESKPLNTLAAACISGDTLPMENVLPVIHAAANVLI